MAFGTNTALAGLLVAATTAPGRVGAWLDDAAAVRGAFKPDCRRRDTEPEQVGYGCHEGERPVGAHSADSLTRFAAGRSATRAVARQTTGSPSR